MLCKNAAVEQAISKNPMNCEKRYSSHLRIIKVISFNKVNCNRTLPLFVNLHIYCLISKYFTYVYFPDTCWIYTVCLITMQSYKNSFLKLWYSNRNISLYITTQHVDMINSAFCHFVAFTSHWGSAGLEDNCSSRFLRATEVRYRGNTCYIVRPNQQCVTYRNCRRRRG